MIFLFEEKIMFRSQDIEIFSDFVKFSDFKIFDVIIRIAG